jgi:hypothetical protein
MRHLSHSGPRFTGRREAQSHPPRDANSTPIRIFIKLRTDLNLVTAVPTFVSEIYSRTRPMTDRTKAEKEKSSQTSKAIHVPPIPKQTAGAVAGAAIGSIAGPVGAAVGGVVGALAGEAATRKRATRSKSRKAPGVSTGKARKTRPSPRSAARRSRKSAGRRQKSTSSRARRKRPTARRKKH